MGYLDLNNSIILKGCYICFHIVSDVCMYAYIYIDYSSIIISMIIIISHYNHFDDYVHLYLLDYFKLVWVVSHYGMVKPIPRVPHSHSWPCSVREEFRFLNSQYHTEISID